MTREASNHRPPSIAIDEPPAFVGADEQRRRRTGGDHFTAQPATLSVIAPCLNEEGNVAALVSRTLAAFSIIRVPAEIVLVDDGSIDHTWERIERGMDEDTRVRGVRHPCNRGIEAAWRSGIAAAAGSLVCLIDADLQNRPEDIPRLYQAYIRELPDLVQGVRQPVRQARQRQLFSRGLNLTLNLAFGMRLRDNKSGFILARRDALIAILRHRYRYWYFQSFIGVAAKAAGLRIAEVETSFEPRTAGRSFLGRFPIGVSARILWELSKFRYETWRDAARGRTGAGWNSAALPRVATEA